MKCRPLGANLASALHPCRHHGSFRHLPLLMRKVTEEREALMSTTLPCDEAHPKAWDLGSDYIPGFTYSELLVTGQRKLLSGVSREKLLRHSLQRIQRLGSPPLDVCGPQKGIEGPGSFNTVGNA